MIWIICNPRYRTSNQYAAPARVSVWLLMKAISKFLKGKQNRNAIFKCLLFISLAYPFSSKCQNVNLKLFRYCDSVFVEKYKFILYPDTLSNTVDSFKRIYTLTNNRFNEIYFEVDDKYRNPSRAVPLSSLIKTKQGFMFLPWNLPPFLLKYKVPFVFKGRAFEILGDEGLAGYPILITEIRIK